jgi:hypothetical protein
MKTQLITLAAAARYLGICEPVTRRLLRDHATLVGTRKRYSLAVVERIAASGTVVPHPQAPYVTSQQVAP